MTGVRLQLVCKAAVMLTAAACERQQPAEQPRASDTASHADARPFRAGIVFDPSTTRPGQRVGTLVLESISATPTVIDSTLVGTARFRGEIELRGQRMAHHDSDITVPCFEADSLSASRLPRWRGDERRMWFCFANEAVATRALAGTREGDSLSVVIDDFTIYRQFSDVVNSARFIR